MAISLPIEQTPFDQNLISLPVDPVNTVAPPVADNRADKAYLGLGHLSDQSPSDMSKTIQDGKEDYLRSGLANLVDQQNLSERLRLFQKGLLQDVPPEKLNEILPAYSSDPKTIIEQGYAQHVVNPLINKKDPFSQITDMKDTQETMPEFLRRVGAAATDLSVRTQVYHKELQDLEANVHNQSWLGWTVDTVRNLFQPYVEYKLRGNTDQSSAFANVFLGETLRRQADDINAMPNELAFPKLKQILDGLSNNPELALKFMHYVIGSTNDDRFWDDSMTGLMAAGATASVAKRGLYAIRAARKASEVAKSSGMFPEGQVAPKVPEPTSTGKSLPDVTNTADLHPEDAWEGEGGSAREHSALAGETPIAPVEAKAVATGDLQEQAVIKSTEAVKHNPNPVVEARNALFSLFKGTKEAFLANPGNSAQEIINRVSEGLDLRPKQLRDLIETQLRTQSDIDYFSDEALVRAALDYQKDKFPGLQGNVLDVRYGRHDPYSNSHYFQLILGNNDATWFKSEYQARKWAKLNDFPITEYWAKEVKDKGAVTFFQDGQGWGIAKEMPVRVDDPFMLQLLEQGGEDTAVRSKDGLWGWIGQFGTWARTPEETLPLNQRMLRVTATYGAESFYRNAAENQRFMGKLSRKQTKIFNSILKMGQREQKFYNLGELNQHYMQIAGRLPEEKEVLAHLEFRSNYLGDLWFRSMAKMRIKSAMGGEEFTVSSLKDGKKFDSPTFEGFRASPNADTKKFTLPGGQDSSIAVVEKDLNKSKVYSSQALSLNSKKGKQLIEDLNSGKATLIHVLEPEHDMLAGYGSIKKGDNIQHVITYKHDSKPLQWLKQVPQKGGGHLDQEAEHYLSQAKVDFNPVTKRWHYKGDTNLMGVNIAAEGKAVAKLYDNVRLLIKEGDEEGARKLATSEGTAIPTDYATFRKMFEDGRLNKNEPIQLRPKDKAIIDLNKDLENRYPGKISDLTKEGSPLRNKVVQYTGQRDAYDFYQVQDKGTKFNPLFELEPGKVIDPIPMMNRGLGRIVNSLFMDEYKTGAVNNWLFGKSVFDPVEGKLRSAMDFMKDDAKRIMSSPFYYFNNAEKEFKNGTPLAVKSELLANRMKIRQFLGTPSVVETFLHNLEQKMADSIYGKFGPKGLKYLYPLWKIPTVIGDAPGVMRSIIYETKMGFFSPRQFLIHAFTYINAALIAPKYAGIGAMSAMLHGWSWLHAGEDVLEEMDKMATKMGWRPGEWKEAREGLIKTNFLPVDKHSLALNDNPMADHIIKNKLNQFLDLGSTPFRGGVKSLKSGAWYMAFKEFKDKNPTKLITDHDLGKILLRADDFSHNMSRASTSAVQKGINTFGAQFSSYSLRLLELGTGKRLTTAERARLFLGYGTLFGVPTAGGVIGFSNIIRKEVAEGNVPGLESYVPGHDTLSTFIMEGGLATLLAKTIGGGYGPLSPILGDIQKGNVYNIGESYGSQDLQTWERNLSGEATLWDTLGGAAYSTFKSGWNNEPFRTLMNDMLHGQGQFKPSMDAALDFLREISSVNYATRTYLALETGKWFSRNNAYLEDVTPADSIFRGISGLQSANVAALYPSSLASKEREQAVQETKNLYAKYMARYFEAMDKQNETVAQAYIMHAALALNAIPEMERGAAIAQAYRDNQPLVDRISRLNLTSRTIPDSDRARQQDIFNKQQEINAKHGR